MVKSRAIFFVASALCLVALVSAAPRHAGAKNHRAGAKNHHAVAKNQYNVEGRVYCDTCRTQFITKVSIFLAGAKVRLECRNLTGTEKLTYSAEAVTDKDGKYIVPVSGDYEDDNCEIVLVKSPMPDCSEVPHDTYTRLAAKVSLTSNNGVVDTLRHANPLGFLRKTPLPECGEALKEIGLNY